jgi:M6 family metalloprotease-like protein
LAGHAGAAAGSSELTRCGVTEAVLEGDAIAVGQAHTKKRSAEVADCTSIGEQRVAVIRATFPGVRPPETTAAAMGRLLFDDASFSANTWYREASYGKVSLSGAVFGPYTLDRSYTCSELSQMRTAAIRAADRDVNFSQYQRFILVYPPIRNCTFGGLGQMGCYDSDSDDGRFRGSWIWINYIPDSAMFLDLLMHEFGHNLGLGHSRLLRFPGDSLEADDHRAVPLEYGDGRSIMGHGRFGDFASAHKLRMGWLENEADVITVDRDGEFVLAPLGNDAGVRALRVRRNVGADEWLWVEYRGSQNGVLVRRETPASAALTHLLDMTPASLDDARLDMGAASEAQPELPAGSTWADPHSDLTISVSEAGPDGTLVTVRYVDRCGVPDSRRITVSSEEQEISLPVGAPENCEWSVKSGRTWLSVSRDGSTARVKVSALTGELHRTGVVSVGRHTISVLQKAAQRDLETVSVSPGGAEMPLNSPVPFTLQVRDGNGEYDTQALQLSVVPGPGSNASPCYFRHSIARKTIEVSDDGESFRDSESPEVHRSGSCGLAAGALSSRVGETDILLAVSLMLDGGEGDTFTLRLRAEDASGEAGPWIQASQLIAGKQCMVLPQLAFLFYVSGALPDQRLRIVATPSPCEWAATADVPWIQLKSHTGADGGEILFDLAANPEATTREGRILINGAPVRIQQFGKGEILPRYVEFRPVETEVSGQRGVAALAFSYGLSDLIPAVAEVPWLQVYRIERAADRREISYLFDGNPEASPRIGTINVGGRTFTVRQQAGRSE